MVKSWVFSGVSAVNFSTADPDRVNSPNGVMVSVAPNPVRRPLSILASAGSDTNS